MPRSIRTRLLLVLFGMIMITALLGSGAILQARDAPGLRQAIAMTAVALTFAGLATILVWWRILAPLHAAAGTATRIATGALDTPIPDGRPNEIGQLLAAMAALQRRSREEIAGETRSRRSAQGRLVEALESSTEAMLLLDRDDRILVANSRVREFLAPVAAEIREGQQLVDAFKPEQAPWAELLSTPGEVLLPNGCWLSITCEETVDGGQFLILSEITLRKSYELKLEAAAYQDPLTGLNNRTFLFDRLAREKLPDGAGILIVNIDRFRQINNAQGQHVGDAVLIALAERLRALSSPGDICARIGSDEFALCLRGIETPARDAVIAAARSSLTLPVAIGDHAVALRLSAGLAWTAADVATGPDLLRDARAALDRAKASGGDRLEIFDESLRAESRLRSRIEQELPAAIRERRLHLEYQPLIDLASGQLKGFEALARWRHPVLGGIAPLRFIPIAEETGAIVALGELVLDEASAQAERWACERGPSDGLTVAVNLSPRQIADPRNAERLLHYLDRHRTACRHIKLEITEGVLLEDPAAMLELLREFSSRGVELSLDDFGTGYSSLSYLHKFPFDELKIDRSFTAGIGESVDTRRLIRTIVELGQDLGLRIVAEGVETAAQADYLRELGCTLGQGYFFSKPVDADRASEMQGMEKVWL
jgi:diguanylate cyclase (GGDEF)-like protein